MKKREVKELMKNSREDRFLTDKEGKFSNWKCLLFCFITMLGIIVAFCAILWLVYNANDMPMDFFMDISDGYFRNIYSATLTILFFLAVVFLMYNDTKRAYNKRHEIESQVNKYYE